jgi:hypothetical protein
MHATFLRLSSGPVATSGQRWTAQLPNLADDQYNPKEGEDSEGTHRCIIISPPRAQMASMMRMRSLGPATCAASIVSMCTHTVE